MDETNLTPYGEGRTWDEFVSSHISTTTPFEAVAEATFEMTGIELENWGTPKNYRNAANEIHITRAKTADGERQVVVRMTSVHLDRQVYEFGIMKMLRERGVPHVAHVVEPFYFVTRENVKVGVAIQERLPGETVELLRSPDDRDAVARQAGAWLAEAQSRATTEPFRTAKPFWIPDAAAIQKWAAAAHLSFNDVNLIESAREKCDAPHLAAAATFAHGELHPKHVLAVRSEGGNYELSGVVDIERASWTLPEHDFGQIAFWAAVMPQELASWLTNMRESYDEASSTPKLDDELVRLASIAEGVSTVDFFATNRMYDSAQWAADALRPLLRDLA